VLKQRSEKLKMYDNDMNAIQVIHEKLYTYISNISDFYKETLDQMQEGCHSAICLLEIFTEKFEAIIDKQRFEMIMFSRTFINDDGLNNNLEYHDTLMQKCVTLIQSSSLVSQKYNRISVEFNDNFSAKQNKFLSNEAIVFYCH
jgi:hypothetical protein